MSRKLLLILVVIVAAASLIGGGLLLFYRQPLELPNDQPQNTVPPVATKLTTTKVFSNIDDPTAIEPIPGTKYLSIVEQGGTVKIAKNGTLLEKLFIDISGQVLADGEMGLLGIAFHPDIQNDKRVFLNYVDNDMFTNISSYKVNNDLLSADPTTEKVLIRVKQPYKNHNGGQLAFGPDGYLYIALGDGGSGGDPGNRAQNLATLLGKILRIDINNGTPYTVPTNNPFVKTANAKGEIWHYGLRNPWRFSFDKQSGDMWLSDVGQNKWEEVNFIAADSEGGLNFGWRCYEAGKEFNLVGCKAKSTYTEPLIQYEHRDLPNPCSVTGGYVYRGSAYPSLAGKYFYADLCTGEIFAGSRKNGVWKEELTLKTKMAPSTFGQDSNGELYIADIQGGAIYRIGAK